MKSQLPAAAERALGNYLTLLSSIIVENRFAPVPTAKHMIDCAWVLNAQRSGHR